MSPKKPRNSTRARKARSAKPSPKPRAKVTAVTVGTELRGIVKRLQLVESHIIVCRLALDGQNAEHDKEVATLLRHDVGDLLFRQIRSLENIAAQCDGGPGSDREDDDEFEDDDTEGQP